MYPAFDWSEISPTIMDISARAISLADKPQRAIRVTSVRMRREDRSSISFLFLSQTSAGKGVSLWRTSFAGSNFARSQWPSAWRGMSRPMLK